MGRKINLLLAFVAIAICSAAAHPHLSSPLRPLLHISALKFAFNMGRASFFLAPAEGLLIALLFKGKGIRWIAFMLDVFGCAVVMFFAKFISLFVWMFILSGRYRDSLIPDLYSAWHWFWIQVVIFYLVSLVLEWPFVALCLIKVARCLSKKEKWFRKSIWGTLIVQTLSFFAFGVWIGSMSDASLYTQWTIVRPTEVKVPEKVVIYYLASTDGNLYSLELGQEYPIKVCDINIAYRNYCLGIQKSEKYQGQWDLVVVAEEDDERQTISTFTVVEGLQCEVTLDPRQIEDEKIYIKDYIYYKFENMVSEVPRFSALDQSGWNFNYASDFRKSLDCENARDGRKLHLGLEIPLIWWRILCPTQLPNGQVVFQLEHQICILDPEERKVAMLAEGFTPIVTIKKE
jgi:hypothetical protein